MGSKFPLNRIRCTTAAVATALLVVLLTNPAYAHSLECLDIFNGNLRYPITSALLPEYSGEESGKEIEVTNGDFKRVVWFHTRYFNERQADSYVVSSVDGLLVDSKRRPLSSDRTFIFVMTETGEIYATSAHTVGVIHHSSFVAGRPIAAAGEMRIRDGVIETLTPRSGHYHPSWAQMRQFIHELERRGVPVPARAKETFDQSASAP